jgi:hypothetical protein
MSRPSIAILIRHVVNVDHVDILWWLGLLRMYGPITAQRGLDLAQLGDGEFGLLTNAMTSRACAFVAKWCRDSTSCSRVEKNASEAALSKHDPTRPIDCRTPSWRHSFMNSFAV